MGCVESAYFYVTMVQTFVYHFNVLHYTLVRFWLSFALNDYIHGLFSDCISGRKKKRENFFWEPSCFVELVRQNNCKQVKLDSAFFCFQGENILFSHVAVVKLYEFLSCALNQLQINNGSNPRQRAVFQLRTEAGLIHSPKDWPTQDGSLNKLNLISS